MASANTYVGLSFQQAQEKIIEDTIAYQESPDDAIPTFADFIDLPPRSLKDYYATIQHPLSLKSLLKAVRGTSSTRSRGSSGATSPFLTWPQFEKEISYIWVNTFEYNLDDSEIYARGKQLEAFVKKGLKEAKQVVADSTGQSSGPKIRLNLTRKAPHDSPAPDASSPVSNGAPTNGTGRSSKRLRTGTPASTVDQPESAKSLSDTVASPTPSSAVPMKTEEVDRPPSQAASTPGLTGSGMPPPSTASQAPQQAQGAYAQSLAHTSHVITTSIAPDSGLDYSRFRAPGQTIKDALITNIVITSHPGLNVETQFVHDMKAWNRVRQPHYTFHLSGIYNYIQIKPVLADGLINRQHKMYVMINNQILQAMPMIPGHPMDPLHPLFETRLDPGTSRIDIQIRATLPADAPRGPHGEDYEDEYWVICPNLRRI